MLMGVLNKQNLVTQNIQINPESLQMLSLGLLSVPSPSISPAATSGASNDLVSAIDQIDLDRLSRSLNSLLISTTIRQRGFKDYSNTAIPTTPLVTLQKLPTFGMNSKMLFTIEFVFGHSRVFELPSDAAATTEDTDAVMEEPESSSSSSRQRSRVWPRLSSLDTHHASLEAASLEAFYTSLRTEWIAMCRMFALIQEVHAAFETKPHELSKQMRVKLMNLRKLSIAYGRAHAYTVQFQWSRDSRAYEILLGVENVATATSRSTVDTPLINYHMMVLNEIKRYFAQNQSVIALVQLLNYTCVSIFGLARLANIPKFYSKNSPVGPLQTCCGFTLIICSLTHYRLFYYSKYCLDIHVKPNGLVSIRDGAFGLTDINAAIEELCPIQLLSVNFFILIH